MDGNLEVTFRALSRHIALVFACALALFASPARGDDSKRDEAKRLFQYGNDMRRAGDCRRALEYFVQSRALYPTATNTLNTAICLDQTERYDEALELYEELLTRFADKLDADTKRAIAPAMSALRQKVGALDVAANVEGTLLVDSRMRGQLPLLVPVRVLPGDHLVRVLKDGYEPFEQNVKVKIGLTLTVDARLKPLASAGRLRIDEAALVGAEVFVDGAAVGVAPWEGTLRPGEHLLWLRKADAGSAPKQQVIIQGQTIRARATLSPLGPEARYVLEPPTAELWLDGVSLGKKGWQGRLPLGSHTLEVKETGYFPLAETLDVTAESRGDVKRALKPDPKHPRWGVKASGHFQVDAMLGMPLASTLGSGAEGYCANGGCPSRTLVSGWIAGARGAYELPAGIGFGVGAGYMTLHTHLTRSVAQSFAYDAAATNSPTVPTQYRLDDTLRSKGPVVFGGVGYRRSVGAKLSAEGRVDLGVWLAGASDSIVGTASGGGVTRTVSVGGSGTTSNAAAVFVMPSVALQAKAGKWRAGLSVSAAIFATGGPTLGTGDARVNAGACSRAVNGRSIDCAPDVSFTRGEKAFGRFIAVIPGMVGGYEF